MDIPIKTIAEKSEILIEEIMYCDLRTEDGIDKAKRLIRLALRKHETDIIKYKILS